MAMPGAGRREGDVKPWLPGMHAAMPGCGNAPRDITPNHLATGPSAQVFAGYTVSHGHFQDLTVSDF